MVMILVMLKILVFALCAGAAISIIVLVPLFFYNIPYVLWVGRENTMGRQKDKLKKGESVFRTTSNATKLYKAWITRQTPTL